MAPFPPQFTSSRKSMDPFGPRKSEPMPMDVDVDVPSGGPGPSNHPLLDHPTGLHNCPLLMMPSPSSSPVNIPQETGDVPHGQTRRRKDIFRLEPSILEPTTRKRKHTDDTPQPDSTVHDNAFGDGSNPPPRRVRPRLRGREDREFSPLLIMSPRQEPRVDEETVSVFHYLPDMTDSSHSIQRYFQIPPERTPSVPQGSSSSKVGGADDHKERGRSDSANSLAEVALASLVAPKRGRLSTLQDFSLPLPFEEAKQPSSSGDLVHKRGLSAGPLFLSDRASRTGESEPGGSPRLAMSLLDLGSTRYFDKPLCESPDSIDSADGGLTYPELPTIRITQTEHNSAGSICSSRDGR